MKRIKSQYYSDKENSLQYGLYKIRIAENTYTTNPKDAEKDQLMDISYFKQFMLKLGYSPINLIIQISPNKILGL